MTEDEAKKKWCPWAREMRDAKPQTPASNGTMNFACIASQCMAWRWAVLVKGTTNVCLVPNKEAAEFMVKQCPDVEMEIGGYCGNAGQPG